jgi:hypothetical protein
VDLRGHPRAGSSLRECDSAIEQSNQGSPVSRHRPQEGRSYRRERPAPRRSTIKIHSCPGTAAKLGGNFGGKSTPLKPVAPNKFRTPITNRNKPLRDPAVQHILRSHRNQTLKGRNRPKVVLRFFPKLPAARTRHPGFRISEAAARGFTAAGQQQPSRCEGCDHTDPRSSTRAIRVPSGPP